MDLRIPIRKKYLRIRNTEAGSGAEINILDPDLRGRLSKTAGSRTRLRSLVQVVFFCLRAVFWIHDILVWIRIRNRWSGSTTLYSSSKHTNSLDPFLNNVFFTVQKQKLNVLSLDTQIWILNPDPCLYQCLRSLALLPVPYCSVRGSAPLVTVFSYYLLLIT